MELNGAIGRAPADSQVHAIKIEDLRLTARGKLLLDGFSLELAPEEKCTITGPSGGGKSTLLRCLLGFAAPAAGRVEVEGKRLDVRSVWRLRRRIAWVAQEPELGEGTAREAIERPFSYKANRAIRGNLERTSELAKRFLLDAGVFDQPVSRLSGGEKQRVALIVALLLDRPILLLDEASSALDAESRAAVRDYLAGLERTTILSVAHDPQNFALGSRLVELPAAGGAHGAA